MSITLVIQDARWRKLRGLSTRVKRAVKAALAEAGVAETSDLTVMLTTNGRVQKLNAAFRGKDKPTNVLSFPAGLDDYLGDVAIAYGVTAREAKEAKKTLLDHTTHLTVHGVLHLLGYDHVTTRQANKMEPMEVRILQTLKVANPYEAP
ncbi:MAG: rRNA maturation RNase YbeY [Rhizomicrobium sp.]|nr:rRNA maturation RNase YbeY [Rhizomicrobium sp.]